jgi:hypothetical protein
MLEHSHLSPWVVAKLRRGEPISRAAIDELERLLKALRDEGWSGFITADEAVKGLAGDPCHDE